MPQGDTTLKKNIVAAKELSHNMALETKPSQEDIDRAEPTGTDKSENPKLPNRTMIYIFIVVFIVALGTGIVVATFQATHHERDMQESTNDSYVAIPDPWNTSSPSSGFVTEFPSMMHSTLPSTTENPSGIPTTVFSAEPSSEPTQQPSLAPSTEPTSSPTEAFPAITTFYAIGDVPYTPRETDQLIGQMQTIPDDAEFVIHVGDIRKQSEPVCQYDNYQRVASILRLSHAPVFIVVGDNEWNDCSNHEDALKYWHREFQGFASRYWNHNFDVRYQPGRTENFSFIHKKTLFIGLNIVGGDVHNRTEWDTRLTEQYHWTRNLILSYNYHDNNDSANGRNSEVGRVVIFGHADPRSSHSRFFSPLVNFVSRELKNSIPILYLHGDRHQWVYETSFRGQPSMLRIILSGGTVDPPLKVSVVADGTNVDTAEAFFFDRQLY